ncbi:Disease resistance protein [Spatholobus suberectus]|nr:Disease resistance protein [Spatholobus suberectus]
MSGPSHVYLTPDHNLTTSLLDQQPKTLALNHKAKEALSCPLASKELHNLQPIGTYVYPGSKVPKWLEYKTTHDYVTIDLSFVLAPHPSHLGFIFGFIVPEVPYGGSVLKFKISIGGEDNNINVYLDRPRHGIKSDHVYLMYDQACSRYLNSRAKHQPRLKIKVTVASRTLTSKYVPWQLRGFGVSTINTTQYLSFVQKVESGYSSIPNVPIVVKFFWTFCIAVFLGTIWVRRLA